jgi:hypothetical protein
MNVFIFIKQTINYLSDLLRQLCKKGLPTGNIYEFAAQTVLKYEKKLKS